MSRAFPVLALVSVAITPLAAQAQRGGGAGNAAVQAVRWQWQSMSGYVLQAAQDMPEAKYSYRPTPEVRTFGEIIGHVAGSQRMFCAMALGEQPPAEDAVEKAVTTKAGLVQAMRESNEYCDKAYQQTDAAVRVPANLFGQNVTRLHALVINATHDGEHYGNLVTYLRLNGMVPPSSKGGGN